MLHLLQFLSDLKSTIKRGYQPYKKIFGDANDHFIVDNDMI